MFSKENRIEAQARQAQQQAWEAQERARIVWENSPVGQATIAWRRGDWFFEMQVDTTAHSEGVTLNAMAGRKAGQPAAERMALLAQVVSLGWQLIHANYVYVQTGSSTMDKLVFSGQHIETSGKIVGCYLFRRGTEQ